MADATATPKTAAVVEVESVSKGDASKHKDRSAQAERRQRHKIANVPTPSRAGRFPVLAERSGQQQQQQRCQPGSLEDVLRRKGIDEAWNTLEEMQRKSVTCDKYSVSRLLMKTVGDARSRLNAPRVYRGIGLVERFIEAQPTDVDEVLFNALLDTCCRLKDLPRLESIAYRMKELKVTPSPVTLGILVKTYGQAGDSQKVLQLWTDMDQQRRSANAVTYGCMIDACVKCGHLGKALEIFAEMKQEGKHKNTILYTTLIKGCGLEKDLPKALELFREMSAEGVPCNTITYNSILEACVKCNDLEAAEGIVQDMLSTACSVQPDLITFSTVLKGYCHSGCLDKALQMLDSIKGRGLHCDELVYNTLMDGCVKAHDLPSGVRLFEEMIGAGLRPSAITHSILTRLHLRVSTEEEANDAVAQLYQVHGIERPSGSSDTRRSAMDRSAHYARGSPLASPTASDGAWSAFGFETMTALAASPMAEGSPVSGSPLASPMFGGGNAFCMPTMSPMGSPCGGQASLTWMSAPGGYTSAPMAAFGPVPALPHGMGQQSGAMGFASQPSFPSTCMAMGPGSCTMTPGGGEAMQLVAVPMMFSTGSAPCGDCCDMPPQAQMPLQGSPVVGMPVPTSQVAVTQSSPVGPAMCPQMQTAALQQPVDPQQLQQNAQMAVQMQQAQMMQMQPMPQMLQVPQVMQMMQMPQMQQVPQMPHMPQMMQMMPQQQAQGPIAYFENFGGQRFIG
eukprot:CAMPEP_0176036464 /NCGR_PEP_ID=MMETSP0120_2-20121206/18059_1 /TAXON_ID=160619 /ORGANISM="Kryptoperidinium foliaceum, Strain CCMP 1326" /LENGTH=733 /DNA_ID=CAMNT_0017369851 /DNA_START=60 /DNA_END=2261 /DNA_ORIENTATION=-